LAGQHPKPLGEKAAFCRNERTTGEEQMQSSSECSFFKLWKNH
jgi:hypothetical protein